ACVLSILTVTAQRFSDCPVGSGLPVNGATSGFGLVVRVVFTLAVVAFLPLLPPHAASNTTSASAQHDNDERRDISTAPVLRYKASRAWIRSVSGCWATGSSIHRWAVALDGACIVV